jgi:4'-phosphopantetheinyl transferase
MSFARLLPTTVRRLHRVPANQINQTNQTNQTHRVTASSSKRYEAPVNGVHTWWLPLTLEAAASVDAGRLPLLTEEEKLSLQSPSGSHVAVLERKHRLISRYYLRHVLSRYTGLGMTPVEFVRNDHGKPFLPDPNGHIKFNMSHANGIVGIAVSRCDVGVDVELMGRRVKGAGNEIKLARRYFSDVEVDSIERYSDDEERRKAFIKIWTLKEAYVKAVGRGIGAPPGLKAFGVTVADDQTVSFFPGMNEPGKDLRWHFSLLEPFEGSIAAVCVQSGGGGDSSTPPLESHVSTLEELFPGGSL